MFAFAVMRLFGLRKAGNPAGGQRFGVQKAITTFFIVAFAMLSANAFSAGNEQQKEEAANAEKTAWEYFRKGEYDKARTLVDKYFQKDNRGLALLSGMLYSRQDKCVEALKAIEYIENYYDSMLAQWVGPHKSEAQAVREKMPDEEHIYKFTKIIAAHCNHKLDRWVEAVKDAEIVRQYSPDDASNIATLGDSYSGLARQSRQAAVEAYLQARDLIKTKQNANALSEIDFDLAILYAQLGEFERAASISYNLLKNADNKNKWFERMRNSGEFALILANKRMKNYLAELSLGN